jgi:hypothetical protein
MLVKVKNNNSNILEKSPRVKLNINTLIPHFTYVNNKGELLEPKDCCIRL